MTLSAEIREMLEAEEDKPQLQTEEKVTEKTEETKIEEKVVSEEKKPEEGIESVESSPSTQIPAETGDKSKIKETVTPVPSRLLKVKVDKEEKELPEEDVVRGFQLAEASNKRFREASELAKGAQQVLDLLDKDPIQVAYQRLSAKYKGDKTRAEKELYDQCLKFVEPIIRARTMTPEEREAYEENRRYEQEKRELELEKERLKREKEDHLAKIAQEKFEVELKNAIDKFKIPTDQKTLKLLGRYIRSEFFDNDVWPSAEDACFSFKQELDKQKQAWQSLFSKENEKPPVTTNNVSGNKTPTPAPFPSTKSGEGTKTERSTRPKVYRSAREWRENVLGIHEE